MGGGGGGGEKNARCFMSNVKMVNMLTTLFVSFLFLNLHINDVRSTFRKICFVQSQFINCLALFVSSLMAPAIVQSFDCN